MTKVLITDPIDQTGIDILSQVAQVDEKIGISQIKNKNKKKKINKTTEKSTKKRKKI
jgi:hypothetical protein